MSRILITGSNGFLGKNLTLRLLKNGYKVNALSRHIGNIKNVNYISGDINNYSNVANAIKNCSSVFHLAAITPYDLINNNRDLAFYTYLQGSLNILKAFHNSSAHTLIYASSGKVYGRQNSILLKENMSVFPTVYMGKLKKAVEDILYLFSKELSQSKRIIVLRIFNAYGPLQSNHFLIPKLISSINNNPMFIGNENIKRDYIYIDDIINAFTLLLDNDNSGFFCYNVGSGTSTSIKEIIEIVEKVSLKKVNVIFDESKTRIEEQLNEVACIDNLKKLGWSPKTNLEMGIKAVYKAMSENYSQI